MDNSTCFNCSLSTNNTSKALVGWTLESPGRGTLSLILTCLTTIALCTWVVIHPRIDKRKKFRVLHKLALFLKTFLAPELIAVEGAQEWTQARDVVKRSAKYTNGELTLVQAFYVGMFGIRYRTLEGTKILWPNQFVWLLEQGLWDWHQHREWGLDLHSIKDKGNADATAKLFAVLQSVWFVAQSIMRAAHDLPLAPLESMTLGYIPLFAVTYFYWWVKPKDVETPTEIDLPLMSAEEEAEFHSLVITDRFDGEGKPEQESLWQVWALTPRTFEKEAHDRDIERAEQEHKRESQVYLQHVKQCKNIGCSECQRLRPGPPRSPDDVVVLGHWDPHLYHSRSLWPIICLAGVSFPALHLVSWNTTFPTRVESWLWRAAAMISIVSMFVFMQFEKVAVRWRDPLMMVKIGCPALYLISRVVMLGGAIAAFRASDPAIYQTYVASTYWVHLL